MLRVWILAVSFCALAIAGILTACGNDRCAPERPLPHVTLDGAQGVLVGSSLIGSAAPDAIVLPATGKTFRMLSIPGASAATQLRVARAALDRGATEIVIEIQPFVTRLRTPFGKKVRTAIKASLAADDARPLKWRKDGPRPDRAILRRDLVSVYPPRIIPTPDPEGLRRFLAVARLREADVLFVAIPMSASAAGYSGKGYREAFRARVAGFGARFGVDVWTPAFAWPDHEFRDRAHLDAEGRRRFTDALVAHLDGRE